MCPGAAAGAACFNAGVMGHVAVDFVTLRDPDTSVPAGSVPPPGVGSMGVG